MSLKKVFSMLAIFSSLFFCATALAQHFSIDTKEGQVYWKGTKVGGMHDGHVPFKSGHLIFEKGELKQGEFTVDLAAMTNKDLSGDMMNRHLKSDDFFSTDKYPTSKLVFTNVKKLKDNKYEITGDLTIKDQTHPVTFEADVSQKENQVTGKTQFTFDRTKYGIRYNSGNFFQNLGDKLIHDDVTLSVDLVANKKD